MIKIITILFMSHRIQAKIYESDTFCSFLMRLRKILPNIDNKKTIALYHLFFIKLEEDEKTGTIQVKHDKKEKKSRRTTKDIKLSIDSESVSMMHSSADADADES